MSRRGQVCLNHEADSQRHASAELSRIRFRGLESREPARCRPRSGRDSALAFYLLEKFIFKIISFRCDFILVYIAFANVFLSPQLIS